MADTIDLGFELPWSVHELDRMLREGDPSKGWRGDPRLSLGMGIVVTEKSGMQVDPDGKTRFHRAGDKVGWNWTVYRHNEDGTDTPILTRKGLDLNLIIPKLIEMDPRTPGHENVMDMVEKADAAVQRAKEQQIAEAHGEHLDHLWRLVDERQNGRHTTRQVQGFDERPDRNLAK
jgi:hypothetical protein